VAEHATWAEIQGQRMNSPAAREAYETAKLAFALGEAVRARRLELGWSQSELARSAGMTQPAVARLELGGTVPTLRVLDRIAAALGRELVIELAEPGLAA
jgi:ribosome-binding protein aMBF1 (putative translation factor)